MEALRQPTVLLLGLTYFCYITNSVGLGTWLPKIVQGLGGLSTTQVSLISAIPWMMAIPAMILNGFHSDRTGERRWHAALPLMLVGIGLGSSVMAGSNVVARHCRVLGGDDGALRVPVAVLDAADAVP